MKTAIVQPLYFPWIGYFALIDIVDIFVFYDDVQFVKQSWQQRNKIRHISNEWIWLTVPVLNNFGQKINDVLIDNKKLWKKKHWKSIYYSYKNTTFFKKYELDFQNIFNNEWTHLAELNIYCIKKMVELLDINKPEFVRSSDMDNIEGTKTDRVISILKYFGSDHYISGPAAKVYIDINKVKNNNIKLYWFDYSYEEYSQIYKNFLFNMSIIDLLLNVGENSKTIIREKMESSIKYDERCE